MDQGNVGKARRGVPKSQVEQNLPRCVVDMVVAAHDMGDAHVGVIDHDAEIVDRRAVRTRQDPIIQPRLVYRQPAEDQIVEVIRVILRASKPNGKRPAGRILARVAFAAGAVVFILALFGLGTFALDLKLLGSAVTAVGVALRQ